jgi:hypothetical protein
VALCLSILLCGCEVWCLRESLLGRLRSFHHRCVRTYVPYQHGPNTIRHHDSSNSLFDCLGIEPLEPYYYRRPTSLCGPRLADASKPTAAHAFDGMGANPRPLGCPQMTWGRTLKKALRSPSTEIVDCCKHAADRDRLCSKQNQFRGLAT